MNTLRLRSIKRGLGFLIPVALLVFIVTGCASQQEIRAKKSLESATATYGKAKADPNVETYAQGQLADAGKILKAAEQTKDFKEMEQLSYLSEKKSQTALTIADGKVKEKEVETLKKEAGEALMQKRVLEAQLARTQAEARAREAEKAKLAAAGDAATAERAKREAEAKARETEKARAEAEAKAREAQQARLQSMAEAEKAEQARLAAEAKAREAERSRAETEQFLKDLAELQGKQTDRGIVLTLGDVLFAFGKADLAAGAVRNVDKLALYLEKHPDRNVLIEGHTDSVGSDEINLALSQKRADAVKEVLTAKGISSDRILTKGYGKKFPIASNDTDSGRQLNRRVEVVILNEGVKPETAVR